MFRRIAYLFNVFVRSSFFFWFMVVLGLLTALFGPRLLLAQPVTLATEQQWQSAWEGLGAERDLSFRRWEVEGSFSIREEVRLRQGYSDWVVGAGHTLGFESSLLNLPSDTGVFRKLGAVI